MFYDKGIRHANTAPHMHSPIAKQGCEKVTVHNMHGTYLSLHDVRRQGGEQFHSLQHPHATTIQSCSKDCLWIPMTFRNRKSTRPSTWCPCWVKGILDDDCNYNSTLNQLQIRDTSPWETPCAHRQHLDVGCWGHGRPDAQVHVQQKSAHTESAHGFITAKARKSLNPRLSCQTWRLRTTGLQTRGHSPQLHGQKFTNAYAGLRNSLRSKSTHLMVVLTNNEDRIQVFSQEANGEISTTEWVIDLCTMEGGMYNISFIDFAEETEHPSMCHKNDDSNIIEKIQGLVAKTRVRSQNL